ncbi:transposase family protein [Streptomyces sp. NPDC006335]|uniref:transposase family protein n=1 Tax=Streptomyces sp. NPDC006335 TaxID=3156895 RepID=UPI0033B26B51
MAGGNRVSATTVRRWVMEVIELLAARAPRLERTLRQVIRKGCHVVLVDGTLIGTRRRTGADNRRNYSGKHKAHSLLFLALTDDKGLLLWLSAARLGRSSEITTAPTTS